MKKYNYLGLRDQLKAKDSDFFFFDFEDIYLTLTY